VGVEDARLGVTRDLGPSGGSKRATSSKEGQVKSKQGHKTHGRVSLKRREKTKRKGGRSTGRGSRFAHKSACLQAIGIGARARKGA